MLPSGAVRVRVFPGYDPAAGQRHYLEKMVRYPSRSRQAAPASGARDRRRATSYANPSIGCGSTATPSAESASVGHRRYEEAVEGHRFSLYDFLMTTEKQIHQWADEAEAGYDVKELQRRGRGRPGRGADPMQVVAVRLTEQEIAALDAVAEREHVSRSEAIRRALADFAA
jgi:hypothetical protein